MMLDVLKIIIIIIKMIKGIRIGNTKIKIIKSMYHVGLEYGIIIIIIIITRGFNQPGK
jgi:hypothetical protein